MRLERRTTRPLALTLAAPFAAILASLALCAILIALSGAPVLPAYERLFAGAFGTRLAITETLSRATPLILTGLAAAVAFRARLWNIGGEGQFYVGALAVAALGAGQIAAPSFILIPILFVAAALAGMLLLLGPTVLKIRFGVAEVVTTLLLNFVVLLFVSMMIEGPMRDPLAFGWPQSESLVDEAMLGKLIPRTRLHWGLVIAIVLAIVVWIVNTRTVIGFETRAVGLGVPASRFAGLPIGRVVVWTALMSGSLAGLAGGIEVMGLKGYVTLDLSPGFGYAGIVVAMLAQLHPIGVVAAAIFVAAVFVGADSMGRAFAIPSFIADVIVSVSLIAMLVALFFTGYRIRR
jgi:simple sugar transport system permease protein